MTVRKDSRNGCRIEVSEIKRNDPGSFFCVRAELDFRRTRFRFVKGQDLMNSARMGLFLGVVVGCASLSGCGGAALKFNNQMAQVTKDLNAMGMEFGTALKGRNPAEIKAAYDRLLGKFEKIKSESASIKPPDTVEAKEFYQAFQTLLTNQEKMIRVDFKEIVEIQSSPTPDIARFSAVFQSIQAQESQDLTKLRAAQAKFASANNIKIK